MRKTSIIISCFAAWVVNVAGYLVIGKLSPLTFQVLGHAKTLSILIGGYVLFGQDNEITPQKLFGICIALLGTFAYSYYKYLQEMKALNNSSSSLDKMEPTPIPQSEQEAEDLEAALEKTSSEPATTIHLEENKTN